MDSHSCSDERLIGTFSEAVALPQVSRRVQIRDRVGCHAEAPSVRHR